MGKHHKITADSRTVTDVPWFTERLLHAYDEETVGRILSGFRSERPVTLRVNSCRTDVQTVKDGLTAAGVAFSEVPWYADALVIHGAREEELRKSAFYERGDIYLQSLSSMLPPLYLQPQAGESVLDMTAAPGGKTTQMSALTDGKIFITACERDKIRADRLRYNIEKQGAPNVTVLVQDAEKLDDFFRFDRILLDAPCSGSGTLDFSRPVKISERLIENSAKLQKRLLVKALRLLKKGGTLVYSTCSVLPEENGDVISSVLSGSGVEIVPITPFEGLPLLPSPEGTVCVCPDALHEGFFVAKFKKV